MININDIINKDNLKNKGKIWNIDILYIDL